MDNSWKKQYSIEDKIATSKGAIVTILKLYTDALEIEVENFLEQDMGGGYTTQLIEMCEDMEETLDQIKANLYQFVILEAMEE